MAQLDPRLFQHPSGFVPPKSTARLQEAEFNREPVRYKHWDGWRLGRILEVRVAASGQALEKLLVETENQGALEVPTGVWKEALLVAKTPGAR